MGRGLVEVWLGRVSAVVRVFRQLIVMVDLERQQSVPTGYRRDMFRGFGADDRNIRRDNILVIAHVVSI